ncbi:MAG: hypothetical protein GTO24_23540 [candidate division Zixibacteria bacterium]|nr:hypothetical protein [candidate division Zixibacteria bacterium]
MKKLQLARPNLLFFLALFVLSGSSLAQHFVRMTDEQRIELAAREWNHVLEESGGEETGQGGCEDTLRR